MKVNSCPISQNRTDSYLERIEAFFTALIVAVFIITCSFIFPLILLLDYILKLSTKNRSGLFKPVAKKCKDFLNLPRKDVDEAPKKFAKILGTIISFNLIILYIFQLHTPAVIISLIFITFALLEAFFDFCVGCKIYGFIKRYYN